MITDRVINVESALVQTMGTEPFEACMSCQRGHGPWSNCVKVRGLAREITACSNCHWTGNISRCAFLGKPFTLMYLSIE